MGKTPRQQLGAWMRQRIADMDEVILPDLAKQAIEAHKHDTAFLAAWWADTGYQVAYTLGSQICASTRTPTVDQEAAPAAQTERPPRTGWFERLEHVETRHMRYGDMTKPDLLIYAEEHEGPALTELRHAGLARKLAGRMDDDGRRVRDVFKEEEIDRWDRLLKVKFSVSIPAPAKLATKQEAAAD